MARGRRRKRPDFGRWLLVGASMVVAVVLIGAVAVSKLRPAPTGSAAPEPAEARPSVAAFAPYVNMAAEGRPTLSALAKATGADTLTLGFAVSAGTGSCTVEWDGASSLDAYDTEIRQAEAEGITIIVSLGGEGSSDVTETCASADAIQTQLERLVALGVNYLDFDVEGSRVTDTEANAARGRAIATLQQEYPALKVSFTLGAAAPRSATSSTGLAHTEPWAAALAAGASVDRINVMAMDYGGSIAAANMAQVAIAAATGVHGQIQALEGLSSADAWAAVGITPMIGVNDETDELFTVDDAKQVASFAEQNGVGMLSYWAAARDHQCAADESSQPVETCSGITQDDYAFAEVFAAAST